MNDRGIIVQAITGYVKNNKGHVIEIGRDGTLKFAKLLRQSPDASMGFTKRLTITIKYEGEAGK